MSNTYLSRGIDHLGDLSAKLRDLQGYRTLAYELIQNADDARETTTITFNVNDDALIVDNDGVFSDCQNVEAKDCPWKEDTTRGHRCDFHRFRIIASGDKRREEGTTGAFGIGFIAVYQITDAPELISAGRHWILHEDQPEDRRIEVCDGCSRCAAPTLPATRFILPWARHSDSRLRHALQAEAVSVKGPQKMRDELQQSLQIAMLFLKRLRRIELQWAGQRVCQFLRRDENSQVVLSDGSKDSERSWHVVEGEFMKVADALREKHRGRIEAKRSGKVSLAIPIRANREGVLCACLPTEHDVGLPFHLNADFFPTNDRKRVIFGGDYQAEWNRAALQAAAHAFAASIGRLPALLGPEYFWDLLSSLKKVSDDAAKGGTESTLSAFWKAVDPHLRTSQTIYTTDGRWSKPPDVALLSQTEESDAIPLLEALGAAIVHEGLRPYQNLLRSEAVGVPILNIEALCKVLVSKGLNRRVMRSDLPVALRSEASLTTLWREIDRLLQRQQRTSKAKAEDEQRLRAVAIAPARDGALYPCGQVYFADNETIDLFESLKLGIRFISDDAGFTSLLQLCPAFGPNAAMQILKGAGNEIFEQSWQRNELDLRGLFLWFENHRHEILSSREAKADLASLNLYPSSGKLRSLNDVALPGTFDDPLGLADLADITALGGRREFLRDLGMAELDFPTYAAERLPAALRNPSVPAEKRRSAILLLAEHIGEISDNTEARQQLADSPLVDCVDGEFRKAHECYFEARDVRECLGDSAHFVLQPSAQENAVRQLYRWLGVAGEPRLLDIASQIRRLSGQPYSSVGVSQIQKIISYLGKKIGRNDDPPELRFLRNTYRWLPAKNRSDRWYQPNELYASYQEHLFDSQARFLDAPRNIQDPGRDFFDFIGMNVRVPVGLVVKHLLHCAGNHQAANTAIYQFLNSVSADPAVTQLRGKHCLWIEGAYRTPNQVFWGQHPFGRYRWRLDEGLRSYSDLLRVLQVRDAPDHQDALEVLKEVSGQFNATNSSLDDHATAVLNGSWQMLESALVSGTLPSTRLAELHAFKCVPNSTRVLSPPDWIFFENRAGLTAKFGDFLENNVITKPLGFGSALSAAGVRPLGSAVKIEVLECANPKESTQILDRMRSRKNEIGRVLESQTSSQEALDSLTKLDRIRCQAASKLIVRFRLSVFNRDLLSVPEEVPALFQADQGLLLFSLQERQVPWPAIARELAIALFPDEDPGRFAAGLKEVLAAESVADAARILDELGFARLDTSVPVPPPADSYGDLGADIPLFEASQGETGTEADSSTRTRDLTPEAAIKNILGYEAASPSPPVPEATAGDREPSGGTGGMGPIAQKRRPVLRSYVPSPEQDPDGAAGDDNSESRSAIDLAGIARVLRYESDSGRVPTEMPHNHPGYDVESRDASGEIVRYIEVKSFSGRWGDTYADLSRSQFEKANDLGESFWLYAVERADSDDYEIYRIHNPVRKANHFMFDDGWRSLAEPSATSEKGAPAHGKN